MSALSLGQLERGVQVRSGLVLEGSSGEAGLEIPEREGCGANLTSFECLLSQGLLLGSWPSKDSSEVCVVGR